MRDKAMRLSAALSLYALLSLASLLVLTLKLARTFFREHLHAGRSIMDDMTLLMGPQIAQALAPILESKQAQSGGVLSTVATTVLLLFSATSMFMELQDAMNTIWGIDAPHRDPVRQYLFSRLRSLAIVAGLEILLLLSMAFASLMVAAASHLDYPNNGWALLRNVFAPFAFAGVLFAVLFKVLPAAKLKWSHVWAGALVAAGLFTAGRYALILYFRYYPPASLFGAAGSVAVVLVWVYYSSFSLFFGAEFTKAWARRYQHRRVTHDGQVVTTH
jgi:membrane protein